jgi:hypothetical protein
MEINPANKNIFNKIFTDNLWGDNDSKSGPGSNMLQTKALRQTLPVFFLKHQIKTVLDIPCGDFHWMKEIQGNLSGVLDNYIGGDIVDEIVTANNLKYGDSKFRFEVLDITLSKLPAVDVILCRDCLVHLSYHYIYLALKSIKKSGSRFLLTTSFIDERRKNKNMISGGWRPLNFRKHPFFFPDPVDTIVENCTENDGIYYDKSLVLWKINSLNLSFFYFFIVYKRIRLSLIKFAKDRIYNPLFR